MWRRLRCRISCGGRQEASFQDQACCGQEPQQLVNADTIADRRQLVGQCIFVPDRGATADLFRRKGFGHGRCQPQSIVAKARSMSSTPLANNAAIRTIFRTGWARSNSICAATYPPQFQPYLRRAHPMLDKLGTKPLKQAGKPCSLQNPGHIWVQINSNSEENA